MIAAVVCSLSAEKESTGMLIRMISGLILTIVAIRPAMDLNDEWMTGFFTGFEDIANKYAAVGSDMADEARREIIKSETEAYILDIASSYGLHVQVRVELAEGDVPIPETVYLTGTVAPVAKAQLQNTIETDLNIPKERQLWNG